MPSLRKLIGVPAATDAEKQLPQPDLDLYKEYTGPNWANLAVFCHSWNLLGGATRSHIATDVPLGYDLYFFALQNIPVS